jgi:hypothetical protein
MRGSCLRPSVSAPHCSRAAQRRLYVPVSLLRPTLPTCPVHVPLPTCPCLRLLSAHVAQVGVLYFNDTVPLAALTEEDGGMEAGEFLNAWKVSLTVRMMAGSGLFGPTLKVLWAQGFLAARAQGRLLGSRTVRDGVVRAVAAQTLPPEASARLPLAVPSADVVKQRLAAARCFLLAHRQVSGQGRRSVIPAASPLLSGSRVCCCQVKALEQGGLSLCAFPADSRDQPGGNLRHLPRERWVGGAGAFADGAVGPHS